MNFAQKVRQRVQSFVNREQSIWDTFRQNSSDYSRVLELGPKDLEALEREQGRGSMYPSIDETASMGFLRIIIDREEFSLSVKHVCGCSYGGNWIDAIFAICISNPALNESTGNGTTTISVVPDEWHRKIVKYLRDNEKVQDTN